MSITNFHESMTWAEQFVPVWNAYYQSEAFLNYQKGLYKKNVGLKLVKTIRKDDLEWQKDWKADVCHKFNNGSYIIGDEKVRSNDTIKYNDVLIEIVSNTTTQAQGWEYNKDRTIFYTASNPLKNGFAYEPIIFVCSNRFIENICRNEIYPKRMGLHKI